LAITSYNQGVDGLANAVERLGTTDIDRFIRENDAPLFGFAGRNFYVELLAAADLAESLLVDPGPLRLDAPREYEPFVLPAYVKATVLARTFDIPLGDLHALNPAMTGATLKGEAYLPLGYEVRLPLGQAMGAHEVFASLPEKERPLKEPIKTYRVKHGDNLGGIARRHGTSVKALQNLNGITDPRRLRAGAVIKLP
jgi:membrane-bound lytic murein transglycosylase D